LTGGSEKGFGKASRRVTERSFLRLSRKGTAAGWSLNSALFGAEQETHPPG
jgi:hypothetical protein